MNVSGPIDEVANAAAARAAETRLSVLIPFYDSSPCSLVSDLAGVAAGRERELEILCADDGSPDRRLAPAVEAFASRLDVPVRLLRSSVNLGRSRIRNQLAEAARGTFVLFLDGDMRVRNPEFLARYLTLLAAEPVDVAFGGFEMPELAGDTSAYDLHIYDSERSHCLPAAARQESAAKYTYTSNLLVRRDLMLACPFSEKFTGWGWEDVDWSLRAGERGSIAHIDNPAVHAGFSTPEVLLAKFRESVANFGLLYIRHPDKVRGFPIYRASRLVSRLPFAGTLETALVWAMLDRRLLPMRARHLAMKLVRACLYRHVVRSLPEIP